VIYVFNAIHCDCIVSSRLVNKKVSLLYTGAVITAKPGTEPGVHKLLANYNNNYNYNYNTFVQRHSAVASEALAEQVS